MSEVTIRTLESWVGRIVGFRTVSGREDPSLSRVVFLLGEIRTKKDVRDVSTVIASPPRERCKIAASECRSRYIDFHADCRTIAVSITTVDCDIECNLQNHVWISGGRL